MATSLSLQDKKFDYPYFGQHPWYAILLQDKFLTMLFEDGGNPNLFCESGCLFDDIDPSPSAKKQMPIRVSAFLFAGTGFRSVLIHLPGCHGLAGIRTIVFIMKE